MQDQESVLNNATRLFERVIIFSFIMTLLIAAMYVAGNFQGFVDGTQYLLLEILRAIAGITTVGTATALVLEMIHLFDRRRLRTFFHMILLVLAGGISFGITLGSSGILVVFGATP